MAFQLPGKQRISLKEATKMWEDKEGKKLADQTEVKFQMWIPPIEKMDGSTSLFPKCELLSLNTNMIDKISNLNSLKFLKILSVGRNLIKSLQGVEVCAETLEEIWASYNQIDKPTRGVLSCKKLRALYVACNAVRELSEVNRLVELPKLEELVVTGCPVHERFLTAAGITEKDFGKEIGKRIPHIKKVNGVNVTHEEEGEQAA